MSKEAFGYLRVSSVGQIDGHGYERQEQAVQEYARRHGYRIVETFKDAHTGTEQDRPGFSAMVGAIRANGVRTVILERLDRFAREIGVQIALLGILQRDGVALIEAATGRDVTAALNDDPMAKALVSIQGVFHQAEKELLVRKLRKARDAVREAGGHPCGRYPYGGDPNRPAEAQVLAKIHELRQSPGRGRRGMSMAKIAAVLNQEQAPTRGGQPWRASTVRDVLAT